MNARFKKLFADKIVVFSFMGTIFFLVCYGIFLLFFLQKLPPLVPLFNQLAWGEERLATKPQLFIPFVITITIVISNTCLLLYLFSDMPLVTRLVSLTNFLLSLFAFLIIIRTVLISL